MMKTIAFAITLGVAGAIGFAIWRQGSASTSPSAGGGAVFTLPGWEDVKLRGNVPKDIEWTCHREHPSDPDVCKGRREVPIAKIGIDRRPDMGIVRIWSVYVDRSMLDMLRQRWGAPTTEERGGHGFVVLGWCSPDAKDALTVEYTEDGSSLTVTIRTLIGDACKQVAIEAADDKRERVSYTTKARCKDIDAASGASGTDCAFEVRGTTFEIDESGNATQTTSDGRRSTFSLSLGDYGLQAMNVVAYRDDAILIFAQGNHVEGSSAILRIGMGETRPRWRVRLGGFNPGEGIVVGRRMYISAARLIACLDLETGEYVWRHDDVGFDSFERPQIDGENVVFNERTAKDGGGGGFLRVRKVDGVAVPQQGVQPSRNCKDARTGRFGCPK